MAGPVGGQYVFDDGYIANEALTRFRFVKQVAASEKHVDMCDAAGERSLGVVQETIPAADATLGRVVAIRLLGMSVVECGAAVAKGALVTTDNVGRAVTAVATNRVLGYAVSSTTNAGEWLSVILSGPASQYIAA